MFYTTLNQIWQLSPSNRDWARLLGYFGKAEADDEPLSFKDVLDAIDIDGAIWALESIKDEAPEVRIFAIRTVRQRFPAINDRVEWAMSTAEMYAAGQKEDADLYWASILATDEASSATPGSPEAEAIRCAGCAIRGHAGYVAWHPTDEDAKDFIEIFCS